MIKTVCFYLWKNHIFLDYCSALHSRIKYFYKNEKRKNAAENYKKKKIPIIRIKMLLWIHPESTYFEKLKTSHLLLKINRKWKNLRGHDLWPMGDRTFFFFGIIENWVYFRSYLEHFSIKIIDLLVQSNFWKVVIYRKKSPTKNSLFSNDSKWQIFIFFKFG